MLVIALGTQASASTWLFNVLKRIFAAAEMPVVGLSAGDGVDFLDQLPAGPANVVLKAHAMDQRLMRIAEVADARFIVTSRDPLDSAVSQLDRFRQPLNLALVDLTRSFSTIAMIPAGQRRLSYVYESGFTQSPETIAGIAEFLGLPLSHEAAATIFRDHRPDAIKRQIDARLARLPKGVAPAEDPDTHWHPNHISDGRVGKGRDRLPPHMQAVIAGCLGPLSSEERWKHERLRWASDLFSYADGRRPRGGESLKTTGSNACIVYGPYLFLPAGRWRATPAVEVCSRWAQVALTSEIYLPNSGRDVLSERSGTVSRRGGESLAIEFDHPDHCQPVEVRLRSQEGRSGSFTFHGVDLQWLGPLAVH